MKVPMNDLIRVTVSGAGHEARKAMWCGHALKVPEFQTQHSIVVEWCGNSAVFHGVARERNLVECASQVGCDDVHVFPLRNKM